MESERIISISNCPNVSKKSVDAISILVVDDDTTCLSIVAAILKKFKYKVVTVKHANDALYTLRIKSGSFDLVVSDVHMPDMNGFQLQQAIAQEFNLPVVLMSADDQEGVALQGLESGAAFFIYKPISPDDVRDLWQFAAIKRRKNQVVIVNEETAPSLLPLEIRNNRNETTTISVSSSSVNEDRVMSKYKDSKRKSDEKKGETSQKKHKVIWTNSLHNRFLEAIRSIGLDRAVPKKILEVMNVPGLTRENVASHLQKYRLFLRRVSDASHKIQYSADKSSSCRNLLRSSLESPATSPSALLLNRLNKFPYQFSNPEASFSSIIATSGFGQSRLMPEKRNVGIKQSTIRGINADHLITNNGFQNRTSIQGHVPSTSLQEDLSCIAMSPFSRDSFSSSSCKNIGTSNIMSLMAPSENFTYRRNYVGYSISNIKHLSESGSSPEPLNLSSHRNSNIVPNNGADDDDRLSQYCNNSFDLVGNANVAREQLSDVIAGYRVQQMPSNLPLHCGRVGDGRGIHESDSYSPFFDLSGPDALSAQGVPLEEDDFGTTLADHQVNIHNHAQQNEGETFTASNIYGDTTSGWNCYNCVPSFAQSPNQQCGQGLVKFQEFGNSSQFGCNNQQNEHDDVDFLESLLAPFGEDQTLEVI
ncbi:hypothetical protein OROGR_022795 [Orobanche gracilis]